MTDVLRHFVQTIDLLDRQASARLTLRSATGSGRNWLVLLCAHLGDSWLWALLLAWSFYLSHSQPNTGHQEQAGQRHSYACFAGLTLQIAVTLGVKQLVRRPRPSTGHLLYGAGPDQHSFPSGHAMRMAVIGGWADTLWPGGGRLVPLLGVLVMWCRVRLGIHTLGDVLVGWLLGRAIVRAVRWAMRRIGEG
jgi:membrane-associated phospholipid phosphatase